MSWVSRRLALVELLPEAIQQQVREGNSPRARSQYCSVVEASLAFVQWAVKPESESDGDGAKRPAPEPSANRIRKAARSLERPADTGLSAWSGFRDNLTFGEVIAECAIRPEIFGSPVITGA